MQSKVINKTDTEVNLEFKADAKDLEPIVRQVFNHLRQHVKASGFRPGRAPNDIVEKEVGSERVQAEVIEAVAQKLYTDAMKEHDLAAIDAPKVELTKFVPYTELEMKLTVEVLPPIKLADYKKIKKQAKTAKVEAKEVDQVIEGLRIRAAKRKDVSRPAKNGDELVIDFEGKRQGKPLPDASAKDYAVVIGSKRLVPGFEEALVGTKAGGTKKFDVTFPKDYFDKNMAGQKASFEVSIKKVNQLDVPKIDDDFAKLVGPFRDLKQLKDDITKQIQSEKDQAAQRQLQNEVVGELVEKSQVPLPPRLIELELQNLRNDFAKQLERADTNLEDYLKAQKRQLNDLDKELQPVAERRVKTALAMSEVAKQEKLQVTPEELEIRIQLIKGQYQDQKMQEQLDQPEAKRELANQLLAEKTIAKLLEYANKN